MNKDVATDLGCFTVWLLEPGHSEKSYQSEGYLITKDSDLIIFLLYKPTTLKNTNNSSEQNWKPNTVRSAANLSGSFVICVSFDPNFLAFFNGFGLVVAKWVFKLNFSSDNLPSRTESLSVYNAEESIVFMFSRQTDRCLPSREATSPLFSGYDLIG